MFSIKKPKRNFRTRGNEKDDESENELPELASTTSLDKQKKKKTVIHQPLLSFGEDLNEGLIVIIVLCGALIAIFFYAHSYKLCICYQNVIYLFFS